MPRPARSSATPRSKCAAAEGADCATTRNLSTDWAGARLAAAVRASPRSRLPRSPSSARASTICGGSTTGWAARLSCVRSTALTESLASNAATRCAEGPRALGQRRAVELALLAVQPGRIRAGGDRLTEQHLGFAELRQGANRRFRLPHGHGLLGPLLHALQQGDLPVERRHQGRPDLLPAEAVEAGGAQGKVRLPPCDESLRGQLLASLGTDGVEDTLQLRPAPLGVSGLLRARVEPRRLTPRGHMEGGR